MKKQLKKEMDKMAAAFPHSGAKAAMQEVAGKWETEYDALVEAGKTELEAYRQVLKDIEKMRTILENMPKTEEEQRAEKEQEIKAAREKKIKTLHHSLGGLMWTGTVILYFLVSFLFGYWHLTWLLFLSAAMGSILLNMTEAYLLGTPIREQPEKWHGLLWLGITEAYFLVSFLFGHWHLTWLLFVGGAMIEILIGLIQKWRE